MAHILHEIHNCNKLFQPENYTLRKTDKNPEYFLASLKSTLISPFLLICLLYSSDSNGPEIKMRVQLSLLHRGMHF